MIFLLLENILSDRHAKLRKKVIKNDNTSVMDFFPWKRCVQLFLYPDRRLYR